MSSLNDDTADPWVLPLYGYVLGFGELFDAFVTAFSSEAGLFCTAEGCCGV